MGTKRPNQTLPGLTSNWTDFPGYKSKNSNKIFNLKSGINKTGYNYKKTNGFSYDTIIANIVPLAKFLLAFHQQICEISILNSRNLTDGHNTKNRFAEVAATAVQGLPQHSLKPFGPGGRRTSSGHPDRLLSQRGDAAEVHRDSAYARRQHAHTTRG